MRPPTWARPGHCGPDRRAAPVDEIDIASCLADESAARLAAVTHTVRPVAHMAGTDDPDPGQLSYFTTGDGTRIGLIHSQGDQYGGGVENWVIIGGYQGFPVDPTQFIYADGTFTDAGIPQGQPPHQVGSGQMGGFSVDYTRLGADPNHGTAGVFTYAPGGTVQAEFR